MRDERNPDEYARRGGASAATKRLAPHEVPEAQAVIVRLCRLQADVARAIDPNSTHAADCFCGESGFWPIRPGSYRNEGQALDFIENAVREALAHVAT